MIFNVIALEGNVNYEIVLASRKPLVNHRSLVVTSQSDISQPI